MCRTIISLELPPSSTAPAAALPGPAVAPSSSTAQNAPFPLHRYPRDWRRRSADVGGLHLALAASAAAHTIDLTDAASASGRDSWARESLNGSGETGTFGAQGQGWMGGEPGDIQTMFAELLSDMYTETQNSVIDNTLESTPPETTESTRTRLIWSLSRWNFEPHLLEEEELIACTLILFQALFRIEGMEETIPVSMQQITAFVHHLRRIYRYENTYHNFEHALDVLQATQSYLRSAGIVPPITLLFEPEDRKWTPKKRPNTDTLIGTLGLRELFMLYVAAIGHDVGHPGFNNHFMKNAQAPLSLIYHSSALEQMHCQLLLKVMRLHGLGALLDDPVHGAHCRKVLVQSILTTDMSVHDEFMATLKALVDGEQAPLSTRQIVMCQAILKNADISNPTRPFLVSKHWASALMKEWFAQASLEEEYNVQQTVYPSSNPIDEANGQIFFISRFARPLLELTERAVPEMRMYGTHCRSNLKEWVRKKKELKREAERERVGLGGAGGGTGALGVMVDKGKMSSSSASSSSTSSSPSLNGSSSNLSVSGTSMSPRMFQCYHSAFRLTLPPQQPAFSSSSSGSGSGSGSGSSSTNGAKSERDQLEEDSVPPSPSETESIASSSVVFSPISESASLVSQSQSQSQPHLHPHAPANSHRFPSNASASTSASTSNGNKSPAPPTPPVPATHAAIRAASKVGSFRKKSQTNLKDVPGIYSSRKGVRNSWCSGVGVSTGVGVGTSASTGTGDGGFAAFYHQSGAQVLVQAEMQMQMQMNGNGNGNGENLTMDSNPTPPPPPPPASAPPTLSGQLGSSATATTTTTMTTTTTTTSTPPAKLQVPP